MLSCNEEAKKKSEQKNLPGKKLDTSINTINQPRYYKGSLLDTINSLLKINTSDNLEHVSFLIFKYFKSEPKNFYENLENFQIKLHEYKITIGELLCDEIVKEYGSIDKEKILGKADSLFSRLKVDKRNEISEKYLRESKNSCMKCIKNSPQESDPNLLQY